MSEISWREKAEAGEGTEFIKGRKSEPIHIKEILPEVMRDIENRMLRNRSKK